MHDPNDNPWKRTATRVVYSNPWITVREDAVICPDGSPGIYGVVDSKIATGVVALSAQNEVYLVGQYRYPISQYSWEIIEGGADNNESALEAAQRELAEEAGLQAAQWQQLGSVIHLSNCFTSERGYLFLARELSEKQARPDHTEVLQLKKMPLEECIRMMNQGGITDSLTIIGLLRAEQFLRGVELA